MNNRMPCGSVMSVLPLTPFSEELNSLRSALDAASISKRNLELRAAQQSDTVDRLQKANDTLSARALEIADEAAREKDVLAKKYSVEMDGLRKQVKEVEEGADEERSRGQAQRIQLLDEVSGLGSVRSGSVWFLRHHTHRTMAIGGRRSTLGSPAIPECA
jgi:hypothetical protein